MARDWTADVLAAEIAALLTDRRATIFSEEDVAAITGLVESTFHPYALNLRLQTVRVRELEAEIKRLKRSLLRAIYGRLTDTGADGETPEGWLGIDRIMQAILNHYDQEAIRLMGEQGWKWSGPAGNYDYEQAVADIREAIEWEMSF